MKSFEKAQLLYEEAQKKQSILDYLMESNITLDDLENVRYAQIEAEKSYFEYINYIEE